MPPKIVGVKTSLCEIKDNAIIAISGFNMATTPEYLILELYRRYVEEGHPRNIFIISDALPASPGRALDQIAENLFKEPNQEFLRGILLPFLGFSSVLDIEKTDYLLYQAPKPEFALIRASISDEKGNLSLQDEGTRGTVLSIAQAAKSRPSPGMVIAQVRWITKAGTMNPRDVDVPGPLINNIVIAPKEYHWQSATIEYDPRISYRVIPPINENLLNCIVKTSLKVDEKIIARRILLELIRLFQNKRDTVLVNLGIGIPALISLVAAQEDVTELIVSVLESGPWGGIALSGNDFGLAVSPSALSSIPDVFSNFEGGIIDAASLGFLQVDKKGNVNPFMLPGRIFGPGGFPVIAGGVPRIYFGGTFTAGRTEFSITNNKLNIIREGTISKFIFYMLPRELFLG